MAKDSEQFTLLVLAGGMGSRYGGLKQLDGVGPGGETLMEYAIYDAIRAGFKRAVFVVSPNLSHSNRAKIASHFSHIIEVEFVEQHFDFPKVQTGMDLELRTKPLGTGHAVLSAMEVIEGPFLVINADDYYGPSTYRLMKNFLRELERSRPVRFALAGYRLGNTLSPFGPVSRGICKVDKNLRLISITEETNIRRKGDAIWSHTPSKAPKRFAEETLVSLNLFALHTDFFPLMLAHFRAFMELQSQNSSAEFYLPHALDKMMKQDEAEGIVLPTEENWFGITYAEDKEIVEKAIRTRIRQGNYPSRLWKMT